MADEDELGTIWQTPDLRRRHETGLEFASVDVLSCSHPAGTIIKEHQHARHQLVYARSGLMVVTSEHGRWVVPTTRAIWMPAGTPHSVRCVDDVQELNLYVSVDAAPDLPTSVTAIDVGPLLRHLILTAEAIQPPYEELSRDGRVMRLILDELRTIPVLPLYLPKTTEPRISEVCDSLLARPEDTSSLNTWAERAAMHPKTFQRAFVAETGMTFGRWRQRARLLAALEKLAQRVPVIEVALSLGYESPSAFSAMFRKHFGLSPSEFFSHS